jgi:hypothetical protein
MAERILVQRADMKWGWQLVSNGNIIATDGGQGYENESYCRDIADKIIGGHYKDAEKKIIRRDKKK